MRLFIGIPVPMSIRNTLRDAASGMRAAGIGGRYVDPANYHVTVKFLGDCEDRVLLASVADAMRDASAGVRPFRLTLDGYGAFRGAGGHTGHVRISDPDRELTRLYELLDASLAELGFPSGEKRYVPHITLGRSMDPVTEPPAIRCETFVAGSVVLFESVFGPGGVSYTVLHRETFA